MIAQTEIAPDIGIKNPQVRKLFVLALPTSSLVEVADAQLSPILVSVPHEELCTSWDLLNQKRVD
jgi:hypothetical protein